MTVLTQLANPFDFRTHAVRTAIGPDGQAWFCAMDVFASMGITWKGSAGSLKNVPENWKGVCYLQTPGGVQEAVFISEAAVYQTAFRSNKPEAIAFTEWVCGEVLPAIRKFGGYGKVDARERIACSRQIVAVAEKLTSTRDAFAHTLLFDELRELSNLIGRPMPDIALLGTDIRQQPLPLTQPH